MTTIVAKVIIDALKDSIKMQEKISQYLIDSNSDEHIKSVSDDQIKFLTSLLSLFKRLLFRYILGVNLSCTVSCKLW